MSRTDQYSVSVALDGRDLGIWDKLTGGDLDSNETKYKPGAMGAGISLGGTQMVPDVVVSRLYVLDRDHAQNPMIRARVGKGRVTVTKQPLDVDGNVYGRPLVYTGRLKTLNFPDADSEGNAAALVALTVGTDDNIG